MPTACACNVVFKTLILILVNLTSTKKSMLFEVLFPNELGKGGSPEASRHKLTIIVERPK